MKTQDAISRKRQKLAKEIEYWKAREREVVYTVALSPDDQATRRKTILFCQQEAAKLQKALAKLQTRTRLQILAGWK